MFYALIISSILAFSTLCAETKNLFHSHLFLRNHTEGNYDYLSYGLQIDYQIYKEEGLNFTVSTAISLKDDHPFWEFSYKVIYPATTPVPSLYIYPYVGYRNTQHKRDNIDGYQYYINKSLLEVGGGVVYQPLPIPKLNLGLELGIFKDIKNELQCRRGDGIASKFYYNPWGYVGSVSIVYNLSDKFSLESKVKYMKSIQRIYSELQNEITLNFKI